MDYGISTLSVEQQHLPYLGGGERDMIGVHRSDSAGPRVRPAPSPTSYSTSTALTHETHRDTASGGSVGANSGTGPSSGSGAGVDHVTGTATSLRLFVTKLPGNCSARRLRRYFELHLEARGIPHAMASSAILDVYIPTGPTGLLRNFAFVSFSRRDLLDLVLHTGPGPGGAHIVDGRAVHIDVAAPRGTRVLGVGQEVAAKAAAAAATSGMPANGYGGRYPGMPGAPARPHASRAGISTLHDAEYDEAEDYAYSQMVASMARMHPSAWREEHGARPRGPPAYPGYGAGHAPGPYPYPYAPRPYAEASGYGQQAGGPPTMYPRAAYPPYPMHVGGAYPGPVPYGGGPPAYAAAAPHGEPRPGQPQQGHMVYPDYAAHKPGAHNEQDWALSHAGLVVAAGLPPTMAGRDPM